MTTTPNPTAEQIVANVLRDDTRLCYPDGGPVAWDLLGTHVADALRSHGLLSEGTPSEEQIERAARAYDPEAWAAFDRAVDMAGEPSRELMVEYSIAKARDMLTAAGVTPQPLTHEIRDRHGLD